MPQLFPIMDLMHLDIVPSYRCTSANCVGCYEKADRAYSANTNDRIDLDLLLPFLRRYTSLVRVHSFGIFGGECTEYSKCCELVAMLTDEFPGVQLEIVSNGQDHVTIGAIIDSAKGRDNLVLEFSIDGYANVCDLLRGKGGYFDEAVLSIEEMGRRGLAANVHINTRYFPEHEDSIIKLSDYVYSTFGITRDALSLIDYTYLGAKHDNARSYVDRLRNFARDFWSSSCRRDRPRSHPKHKTYDSSYKTCFCTPEIHPDNNLYTCFDYRCGLRAGHISGEDVLEMICRMLKVSELHPHQCDDCLVGQCVLQHYYFEEQEPVSW